MCLNLETVDDVLRADQRRLNLAQQSQERINTIVEGTRSLEDQYRAINKEIDGLKVYNRLMEAQAFGSLRRSSGPVKNSAVVPHRQEQAKGG